MSATTTGAKVYYLPTAEPVAEKRPPSRWVTLRRRARCAWWRLRLSLADVRIGSWRLRRRRRRQDYAALFEDVLADRSAEVVERRRPTPARPATVLDFEAGRLRLRPQAP
jgi:hypothetical protein